MTVEETMNNIPQQKKSLTTKTLSTHHVVMSYLDEMLNEVSPTDLTMSEGGDAQADRRRGDKHTLDAKPKEKPRTDASLIQFNDSDFLTTSQSHEPTIQHPTWAKSHFECLMFFVGGLKLALPLASLSTIYRLNKPISNRHDSSEWFLEFTSDQSEKPIQVLKTPSLVMPEYGDSEMIESANFALEIQDFGWAMSAEAIQGTLSVNPEHVKWRTALTSRPWLAGILMSEKCALLDVEGVRKALNALL